MCFHRNSAICFGIFDEPFPYNGIKLVYNVTNYLLRPIDNTL
jgi:hypothetical protein